MRLRLVYLLVVLPTVLPTVLAAQQKKIVSVEDVWGSYAFYAPPVEDIRWMQSDNYYSNLTQDGHLLRYTFRPDVASADQDKADTLIYARELRDPQSGQALAVDEYSFNQQETHVLLTADTKPIYRHSKLQRCYIFDLKTRKLTLAFGGKQVSNPALSPDGSKLGFTFENNLYYTDLTSGASTQVTRDGKYNQIINGHTDWVYEEEFGFPEGFYFSPDGNRIAYYRFDEREVPLYTMDIYNGLPSLYPARHEFKYPKAGEKNAVVRIFVYDILSAKTTEADVLPMVQDQPRDQYIPMVRWAGSSNQVFVLRINRMQNEMEALLVDAQTGKATVALTEKSNTYIDLRDQSFTFLKDGKHFLMMSEQDGYNHLYLYTLDGKLVNQVTKGEWDVTEIYGVDEKKKLLYYQSSEASPIQRQVYCVQLDGKNKKQLSAGNGWHNATFSSACSYYIDRYSHALQPTATTLHQATGKALRTLEGNEALKARLQQHQLSNKQFFTLPNDDGTPLHAWRILPHNFDSTKKYPVLMFVYGGPGAQTVRDNYDGFNDFWYQHLAGLGYIVVSVENRGTPGRGVAFKNATYGQLGKLEVEDQIAGAKHLASLPYVDASRIGIWGWSYGGYMTALCMTKGAAYFKAGISVAPVTNWRYYDTIYTERYLGLPQENGRGYDENSPLSYAKLLRGKYLVVHGTGDDNVHYQNSLEWVNALVKANKQFDTFFYPNRNHGISGGNTRLHLYTMMTQFLQKNL